MTGLINNIFKKRDGTCPQGKVQQNLHRTDHLSGNNDFLIKSKAYPETGVT
jgi:hypothetical protein